MPLLCRQVTGEVWGHSPGSVEGGVNNRIAPAKRLLTEGSLFASASGAFWRVQIRIGLFVFPFKESKHEYVIHLVLLLLDVTEMYLNGCNRKFL